MPKSNQLSATREQPGISILVVEDSAEDLVLLESLIAPDHQIWGVQTAQEALDLCLEQTPQCVIVDYLLPEMDGLMLASELRKNPNMRHVPIIMWTIFGSAEISVDARKFGVDDQISKQNITAAQLKEIIDRNYQAKSVDKAKDSERQALSHENHELSRRHELFADFWELQSHQLLTDLSSVKEFVSLLMDEIPGPINEEQGKCLAMARGGCVEIQRTIEKIQGLTNLDTNPGKLVWQPVKLQELADAVLEVKRLDAAAGKITLMANYEQSPMVLSDRYVLSQLLESILSTGLMITPPGSKLSLNIRQAAEHHMTVSVQAACEESRALQHGESPIQNFRDTLDSANATNYRCRVLPNLGIEFSFDLYIYAESQDKDAA